MTANRQSPPPEDVTQRAVGATGAQMQERESSKRLQQTSERGDVRRTTLVLADALWKKLVKNVGEPEAKEIMRRLMGDKKPGPRVTDHGAAMTCFIYAYILHFGLNNNDGVIASRIFESGPHYLEFKSGAVAVANSDFTEEYMSLDDDPIIGRRPVGMSLAAIKKRVERLRRSSIEEELLPRRYAPRAYCRD
jgi:hypothetical protein